VDASCPPSAERATALACVLPSALLAAAVPDMWKPLIHLADFLMGVVAARIYELLLAPRHALAGGGWLARVLAARGAAKQRVISNCATAP
jgi:hypothetical protein